MGERSPHWNTKARGAFVGLTIRHTRADMIRAVLEGVAMNLSIILDAFRAQGARIDAIRLIGGGARGRLWNQIRLMSTAYPFSAWRFWRKRRQWGRLLSGALA